MVKYTIAITLLKVRIGLRLMHLTLIKFILDRIELIDLVEKVEVMRIFCTQY